MSSKVRFTHDEMEVLLDMLSGQSWEVLNKWFLLVLEDRGDSVLKYNLQALDDRGLVIAKAKFDGAKELISELIRQRGQLKELDKAAKRAAQKP